MSAFPSCCYLCSALPKFVGVFEPPDPWNYCPLPPAPGKKRLFLYGLCQRCFGLGMREAAERVELKIKADLFGASR